MAAQILWPIVLLALFCEYIDSTLGGVRYNAHTCLAADTAYVLRGNGTVDGGWLPSR